MHRSRGLGGIGGVYIKKTLCWGLLGKRLREKNGRIRDMYIDGISAFFFFFIQWPNAKIICVKPLFFVWSCTWCVLGICMCWYNF